MQTHSICCGAVTEKDDINWLVMCFAQEDSGAVIALGGR